MALHREQLRGDRLPRRRRAARRAARTPRPARGRLTARRAPAPSTAPGRSGCRGCRSCPSLRPGDLFSLRNVPVARSSVSARICARLFAVTLARCSKLAGEREELAEAVPAQVVLLHQLLHVLRRRTAGAGLEQAAAVDQRHDRQHLRRRAELEDREQVGEVVAQHVAGAADRVLAATDALERELDGVDRRLDLDLQAVGVVVVEVRLAPWR